MFDEQREVLTSIMYVLHTDMASMYDAPLVDHMVSKAATG